MKHHWQQSGQPDTTGAEGWFAGRLPEGWFADDPTVIVDREEITVIGRLAPEKAADKKTADTKTADTKTDRARTDGRVARFREETRGERMRIAEEAQEKFGRKVSWGLEVDGDDGPQRILFTHIAVPVMTRLKQPERRVLDTLVEAGVARSRSDALAWSVRLVGQHAEEWLGKLRAAMTEVDDLRAQGPEV